MRFTSAIGLVNRLEPAHLQSFWYFASKVNLAIIGTFGSLLWATSDTTEEAAFYRSQLAEYRWTLRVSSKAAEFMKFTVGMLDASPVFLKDSPSKTSTLSIVRDPIQHEAQNPEQDSEQVPEHTREHIPQDYQEAYRKYMAPVGISPNVSTSTENAYPYEMEYASTNMPLATDIRPQWSTFPENVNFTSDDIQDWSLDRLYNFDNMPSIEDFPGNRRTVEEYDESGNNFAGF